MANGEWRTGLSSSRYASPLALLSIRYSLFRYSPVSQCNAAQTFCGVAGIVSWLLPIASVMALMTAGGEPMAPASPHPLMPSGLPGQGVFDVDTWNDG